MAVTQGVAPHRAWVSINGLQVPCLRGTAEQCSTRQSSTFSADVPLNYPGVIGAISGLGDNSSSVSVESVAGSGTLVSGEIDTVTAKYIEGIVTVKGRDGSAKLHEMKSAEKWTNRKTGDIVQDLAGRAGLGFAGDPGIMMAGKYVNIDWAKLTDGISFAGVIQKCCEIDAARWWCDGNNTLHYVYQSGATGNYQLNYDPGPPIVADFLHLSVKRNIQAGKTINVTVKSWHPKQKQVNQYTATQGGNGGPVQYSYHIPNLTKERVQKHAESRAKEARA